MLEKERKDELNKIGIYYFMNHPDTMDLDYALIILYRYRKGEKAADFYMPYDKHAKKIKALVFDVILRQGSLDHIGLLPIENLSRKEIDIIIDRNDNGTVDLDANPALKKQINDIVNNKKIYTGEEIDKYFRSESDSIDNRHKMLNRIKEAIPGWEFHRDTSLKLRNAYLEIDAIIEDARYEIIKDINVDNTPYLKEYYDEEDMRMINAAIKRAKIAMKNFKKSIDEYLSSPHHEHHEL